MSRIRGFVVSARFGTRWRVSVALLLSSALPLVLVGCSTDQESSAEEIVITCSSCQPSPANLFLQFNSEAVERFNEEFDGQYQVEVVQNQYAGPSPDRLPYYQRLALADDLPNVFLINQQEGEVLRASATLMDWRPWLEGDPEWRDSFHEGVFDGLSSDGQVWAVPQVRDVIGIYYNKQLFEEAGVERFPETWDEFDDACSKIKASGRICFAMDGDWVTLLMWANLVGTQSGGAEFLSGGIADGGWAELPAVVKATETLKAWHTKGYVNSDAFSGNFTDAGTPYATGEAAMIANGPWHLPGLKEAEVVPGLYEATGYAPSPGWRADQRGLMSIIGGAWASGSVDKREQEATVAFLRFLTSRDEAVEQIRKTGSYPPVAVELTPDEVAELEPMVADLVAQAPDIPLRYPYVHEHGPATFSQVWKNLWPAYVKDELSTDEFLQRLTDDLYPA